MSSNIWKSTIWQMRPAKTQISLRIRAVCSEYSLSAWKGFGFMAFHRVISEDSDQTARMRRLIWVFAGRTCHKVHFRPLRFNSFRREWKLLEIEFTTLGIHWNTKQSHFLCIITSVEKQNFNDLTFVWFGVLQSSQQDWGHVKPVRYIVTH